MPAKPGKKICRSRVARVMFKPVAEAETGGDAILAERIVERIPGADALVDVHIWFDQSAACNERLGKQGCGKPEDSPPALPHVVLPIGQWLGKGRQRHCVEVGAPDSGRFQHPGDGSCRWAPLVLFPGEPFFTHHCDDSAVDKESRSAE